MSDEALRMEAEVRDKFTGPLKALRSQLLDTARTGANHSETLTKGFGAVEGALQKTARTASSVVNPAFAALGVTGLTAGAAVAGISNALNKLTGSLTGLGQLSRDTGLAAKTLQEFGAVAGRVGIEQDAVASASKNFAAQMRTFSRSTGDAFNWVIKQGTDAAGRKAFQDFATDLQRTSDEGEKLKKALSFMETMKDPRERGIFAQQFFGNEDLKRLADGHLGTVVQQFKNARDKIGPFNEKDLIDAEKFDRSVTSLKGSMQRLGQTIAREVLGPATELTTWADSLVSGQRADVTKSLREGLQGIKKELGEINFKQAGDDAVAFLKESVKLAGSLAKAFHEVAESIHALREGKTAEVFRRLDGASGPLARRLAPLPGDDKLALNEEATSLQSRIATAREQNDLQADLLKDLDERGDKDGAKRLREAMEANNRHLKSLEDALRKLTDQGAVVSKSSAEGGPFGGATVQTAGFGVGFRRFGGFGGGANLPGGGSGPGYGGEQGASGRGFGGGGRFNGLGGSRPPIAPIGPRPDVPTADPSGGYVGNDGRRAATGKLTDAGRARIASWMEFLQRPVAEGGLGMSKGKAMADIAMMQGESRLNLEPDAMGDHDANKVPHAFGTAQWSDAKGNPRFPLLRRFAESQGKPWTDVGIQQQYHRMEMLGLPGAVSHRRAYDAMMRAPTDEQTLREGIDKYENPQKKGLAYAIREPFLNRLRRDYASPTAERADGGGTDLLPGGAPRLLRPNSMGGAPGLTMDQANAMRAGKADGAGWAAREAARKTFEAQQAEAAGLRAGGARVASAASRAGVVAMPQIENNGSVVVNVHKPGPETRVATTASGKLFQDVVQRSGAQMRKAD